MKAIDVVNRIANTLPAYTTSFSNVVNITSITVSGTDATVTTSSAHGVVDGDKVTITGAEAPVQIASLTRTGTQAQIVTSQDHDLTLSERDKVKGKTVTISGATESQFNGTFNLLNVKNRREITIAVSNSGATTATGSPLLVNANGAIFNGLVTASNVTATTLKYTLPVSYTLPAAGTPKLHASIRIAAVLDINQYLKDMYTKQLAGIDHIIVQLGDVTRNKNANETTDAFDSTTGEYSYTPKLIQQFAIYIIQTMTGIEGGAAARDKVESVYVPAIFKAVERAKFDTGFTYSQYRATCTGHGVFGYDAEISKGKALYIHEMTFQIVATIDKDADTAAPDYNVAMRDVGYTMKTDLGTGVLLADVDLDQVPL